MASPAEPAAGGILYVVATPIGNPADLSPRAIEILRSADLIACEDTRRTGALLAAHAIRKPLLSYFEHNEERRIPEIIARLEAGARIALVTDAGTPGISDPGFRLVRAVHSAAIRVVAVPGPSAVAAALSIAGIATDRFVFEGFLPVRAAARRAALEALAGERRTIVIYEAARRLGEMLQQMADAFGLDREAAVVREMTKTYEETARGTLGELAARYAEHQALGEVTVVVAGAAGENRERAHGGLEVETLIEAGMSLKDASALIARIEGRSRREIYQQALRARGGRD
ncbi:MAG TPA: 16S rRNA (cytidine(1402)-2'-O)-methyltransferase [Candidatus Binataceae bacterium]|nr:16S rRNA (cytidine(1402)-2'-O)-methyltransferase [Candidatus Binataceae bacterium]